jgi:hypothetical protein
MSATSTTHHPKHARLPGKAESLETLEALARLLARQAAAQLFDTNQSAASTQ